MNFDYILWFVIVLGVLIFVHELGHFLVARLMGVRVETFSLGFGPKLLGFRWPGGFTEYRLSAVPLGGYVKMLGDVEDEEEPLTEEELPHAFSGKPVGRRIAIVIAGPAFNFFFAIFALAMAFMVGMWESLPVVGGLQDGMPAQEAGLEPGDRILEIDGVAVERWETLSDLITESSGSPLTFTVERAGRAFQVDIQPRIREESNLFGEPIQKAMIGISSGDEGVVVSYPPGEALIKGGVEAWRMVDLTVTTIWKMLTQVVSADQIGGPILIAELAGETAKKGLTSLLFFMSLISVNLAILNLLPIPILDGGHLLFFIIEAIKGRPLSDRVQGMANRVGVMLLGGLMMLAFYNDLVRVFSDR